MILHYKPEVVMGGFMWDGKKCWQKFKLKKINYLAFYLTLRLEVEVVVVIGKLDGVKV